LKLLEASVKNAAQIEAVNGRLAKGEGWIGYRNASTTPSKYLYFAFYRDGKQVFVNTKTNDPEEAYRQLLDARGATERGVVVLPSEAGRITYEHLRDSYLNGNQSPTNKAKLRHLDKFFGRMKVTATTTDVLRSYISNRSRKVAGPTIRRELTILRAMFNDAVKSKKISRDQMPWFPMPKDSEAAGSYIYPADFSEILVALPSQKSIDEANAKVKRGSGRRNGELLRGRVRELHDLRPFFRFLYATGCRVGAAEKITWKMVRKNDNDEFVIDLPAEIMKTNKGLSLTITGALLQPVADYLGGQFRVQSGFVFDSTNYRMEWNKACDKAGLRDFDAKTRTRSEDGGARLHDCRCSGAVNLLRAGLDEGTVLKIGGWKTRAMLDRYNVLDEFRIAEGLRKGGEFVANEMVARKTATK
jgi:integrase